MLRTIIVKYYETPADTEVSQLELQVENDKINDLKYIAEQVMLLEKPIFSIAEVFVLSYWESR